MHSFKSLGVVVALSLLACPLSACQGKALDLADDGGTPAAQVTLSGTVNGVSFNPLSSLGYFTSSGAATACVAEQGSPDGGTSGDASACGQSSVSGEFVALAFSELAGVTCSAAQADEANGQVLHLANNTLLVLTVGNPEGYVTAGTYPVGKQATADFVGTAALQKMGSTCESTLDDSAVSGSIVVKSVTLSDSAASSIAGSYDVTFMDGGSFSGTFDIPMCQISQKSTDQFGCTQ